MLRGAYIANFTAKQHLTHANLRRKPNLYFAKSQNGFIVTPSKSLNAVQTSTGVMQANTGMFPAHRQINSVHVSEGPRTHTHVETSRTATLQNAKFAERFVSKTALDISFDDAMYALASKSYSELVRSVLIMTACRATTLVKNSNNLIELSRAIVGDSIVNFALKRTFFQEFCGGENAQELMARMKVLNSAGVGVCLDYAAEKDIHSIPHASESAIESELDLNCEMTGEALQIASEQSLGYAAVKLTSLLHPQTMQKCSEVIMCIHQTYADIAGVYTRTADGRQHQQTHADALLDVFISREQFVSKMCRMQCGAHDDMCTLYDEIMSYAHAHGSSSTHTQGMTYTQWMEYMIPLRYGRTAASVNLKVKPLNCRDRTRVQKCVTRLESLVCQAVKLQNSKLLIDAEQSYFQEAIDWFARHVMRKYNTDQAYVYNTVQAYRKDSMSRVQVCFRDADKHKYVPGIKLVRGAYMILERRLANEGGYTDIINDTREDTHALFDECAKFILQKLPNAELFLGTHNEESIKKLVHHMHEGRMDVAETPVAFGQLLGMCDHITLTLGRKGYKAFKYVPYGRINEVMPYLLRRAEENSAMLGGASKQVSLALSELRSRMFHQKTAAKREAGGCL